MGQTSKLGLAKDYILNTQKSALQILQNSLTYHIASVHIDWNQHFANIDNSNWSWFEIVLNF